MFYGEFEYRLDEKNRFVFPKKLRIQVDPEGPEERVFYLTRGLDSCIWLFVENGWQDYLREIRSAPRFASRNFQREFFSYTCKVEPDGQWRLTLPRNLLVVARIKKDITLAGVFDRIEIWDTERWRLRRAAMDEAGEYEQTAERLHEGIRKDD